ncbi:hypothetical protein CY34DRAFT_101335, partial [Suillus luteus UH-Slu-Lm8-n1]
RSMPASRAALTRCVCEECIEKGGYDERGAPKGVLMAERSIPAHVQHVKAESAERAASTKAGKPTVSSITNDLGHLTLSMNPSQPPSFSSSRTMIWSAQDRATLLQFLSLPCQITSSS